MRKDPTSLFRIEYRLTLLTCLLAFCVVLLGAYVRLSDAGLGCPDWPGCYGQMVVPGDASEVDTTTRPLDQSKAWKEMIHRYMAAGLGLFILLIALLAWSNRLTARQPLKLPGILLLLVLFQAMLGMWTVTLLVKPVIVTAEFVAKPKTYYNQNIVKEPFSLKVLSVDGRVLKEAVIIRYFLEADKKEERKLERIGLVQEFEAYETLRQPISATPWLGEREQGTGFYLEHLLHIRAMNKKE